MRNNDQRRPGPRQVLLQPLDSGQVQVVGRLVEQEHIGLLEEQHGQGGSRALPATQRGDGEPVIALTETKTGESGLHAARVGRATGLSKLLLRLRVRRVQLLGIGRMALQARFQLL